MAATPITMVWTNPSAPSVVYQSGGGGGTPIQPVFVSGTTWTVSVPSLSDALALLQLGWQISKTHVSTVA
jgi:hypothetical protein